VTRPEELLPYLNGVIVHFEHKTAAQHPDVWRTYGDPHQILSEMCARLGAQPWAYAINKAQVESFRLLGFNEKEPFQDLGANQRKKKNKKGSEDNLDAPAGDTGGGGGFTF
jgi:AMMECR1 domain-containing protein